MGLRVFDKGIVALWRGCRQFFFPRFYATFFQSPRRFTHLTECDTKVDSSVQLSSFIAYAGRRFFLGGKQPPVAELDPTLSLRAKNGLSTAHTTRLELRLRPITAECNALITKCIVRTERALRQHTKPKNAARTTLRQLTRGLKGKCKSASHSATGDDGDTSKRPRLKPLPCPDRQLLVKWKSDEHATPPVTKGRDRSVDLCVTPPEASDIAVRPCPYPVLERGGICPGPEGNYLHVLPPPLCT